MMTASGCEVASSLVPGGPIAAKAVSAAAGGGPGAPNADAPLVAGDLSIVQHPGSGPLVAATRIEGALTIEQSGAGGPQTAEERAEAERQAEIDVLQRLLDERRGGDDEAAD